MVCFHVWKCVEVVKLMCFVEQLKDYIFRPFEVATAMHWQRNRSNVDISIVTNFIRCMTYARNMWWYLKNSIKTVNIYISFPHANHSKLILSTFDSVRSTVDFCTLCYRSSTSHSTICEWKMFWRKGKIFELQNRCCSHKSVTFRYQFWYD